jgi:hypothetical protein
MSTPLRVRVAGLGFWSPLLPGWAHARDVLLGLAPPPAGAPARPSARLLAPTERRRAPDTVAIALEVAACACEMARLEPRSLPSVFASTHGDLPINDYMCSTLATTPALCSPTRFHNSVHNAAAGYWTIGTGCLQPSTALSAWHDTFANGLLEALVQAVADQTPVLYVAYDVGARGPLAAVSPSDGLLAAALVLDPRSGGNPAERWLDCRVEPHPAPQQPVAVPAAWEALLPANAMRPCLPLLAALTGSGDSSMLLQLGSGSRLAVNVSTCAAQGPA